MRKSALPIAALVITLTFSSSVSAMSVIPSELDAALGGTRTPSPEYLFMQAEKPYTDAIDKGDLTNYKKFLEDTMDFSEKSASGAAALEAGYRMLTKSPAFASSGNPCSSFGLKSMDLKDLVFLKSDGSFMDDMKIEGKIRDIQDQLQQQGRKDACLYVPARMIKLMEDGLAKHDEIEKQKYDEAFATEKKKLQATFEFLKKLKAAYPNGSTMGKVYVPGKKVCVKVGGDSFWNPVHESCSIESLPVDLNKNNVSAITPELPADNLRKAVMNIQIHEGGELSVCDNGSVPATDPLCTFDYKDAEKLYDTEFPIEALLADGVEKSTENSFNYEVMRKKVNDGYWQPRGGFSPLTDVQKQNLQKRLEVYQKYSDGISLASIGGSLGFGDMGIGKAGAAAGGVGVLGLIGYGVYSLRRKFQ